MGAFSTYKSGGDWSGATDVTGYEKTRREFLLDQISYKYPSETPLIRMLPKVTIDTVYPEWVLGTLNPTLTSITASAENENFASTPAPTGERKRAGNYTHIKHKVIEVTDTQRLMDEVGTSDEYATQIWQKSRELAMEIENTLIWSRADLSNETNQQRQMHGLMAWGYDTGDTAADVTIAGHVLPNGTYDSAWIDGGSDDLTITDLTNITQQAWTNGMSIDRSIMFCGDDIYKLISGFSLQTFGTTPDIRTVPLNERTIPAAARTLEDWIEVYQGPFGRLHINKNRYFTERSGTGFASFGPSGNQVTIVPKECFIIFEPECLALGILQGIHVRPGATSTFSSVAAVAAQTTLICRDPRGLAGGHDHLA